MNSNINFVWTSECLDMIEMDEFVCEEKKSNSYYVSIDDAMLKALRNE